ncbi:MAG: TRAP transporter small permease [Oceanospirillales bacterium]|nr:TRAP transporter small permease [Oceanospirillales bacterium]
MKLTLSGSPDETSRVERFLRLTLDSVAVIMMFLLMAVTLVDVLGRYLFSAPLVGAFELTELMLAAVIFLGLPLVTADQGHIEVDLIDSAVRGWLRPVQRVLIDLVSLLAFGVFAWMLWRHAMKVQAYEDTTAVLEIPYAWLAYLMAVTASLSVLAQLTIMLRRLRAILSGGEA